MLAHVGHFNHPAGQLLFGEGIQAYLYTLAGLDLTYVHFVYVGLGDHHRQIGQGGYHRVPGTDGRAFFHRLAVPAFAVNEHAVFGGGNGKILHQFGKRFELVLCLAQVGGYLLHLGNVLFLFDLVVFQGLLIGALGLFQINLILLDSGRWLKLRLLQDNLFFFYGVFEIYQFITCLAHLQGGVQAGLGKLRLGAVNLQLGILDFIQNIRAVERSYPVAFFHFFAFFHYLVDFYLVNSKVPQLGRAVDFYRIFGFQLTGSLYGYFKMPLLGLYYDIGSLGTLTAFYNKIAYHQYDGHTYAYDGFLFHYPLILFVFAKLAGLQTACLPLVKERL